MRATPLGREGAAGIADAPSAGVVLGPCDASVCGGPRVRVDLVERWLVVWRHLARRDIDVDQLRESMTISNGNRASSVRQRIGVFDIREMRDAATALAKRPQKQIVMQKSLAIGLSVRVENRLAIARPTRPGEV